MKTKLNRLLIAAAVTGLTLGLMNRFLGLSSSWAGGGVGGAVGAIGAILIAQRRAALNQQKNR